MTISIVARDPDTGRYGVATTSSMIAVGAHVPVVTGHGALAGLGLPIISDEVFALKQVLLAGLDVS